VLFGAYGSQSVSHTVAKKIFPSCLSCHHILDLGVPFDLRDDYRSRRPSLQQSINFLP
jgi:hypothetical protein